METIKEVKEELWHKEWMEQINFDVLDINKVSNVKATPNDVHKDISAFYSSKQLFTNGKTVQDWLNGQSYEAQYKNSVTYQSVFLSPVSSQNPV